MRSTKNLTKVVAKIREDQWKEIIAVARSQAREKKSTSLDLENAEGKEIASDDDFELDEGTGMYMVSELGPSEGRGGKEADEEPGAREEPEEGGEVGMAVDAA